MKEVLLEKIIELKIAYMDFFKIYTDKVQAVETYKAKLKNVKTEEDIPSPEELQQFLTDSFVDLISYAQDLQMMFNKFGNYTDLYVELYQQDLPEDIKSMYSSYKEKFKINFVLKDGKLIEVEDGALEKRRNEFLSGDIYKNLVKQFS